MIEREGGCETNLLNKAANLVTGQNDLDRALNCVLVVQLHLSPGDSAEGVVPCSTNQKHCEAGILIGTIDDTHHDLWRKEQDLIRARPKGEIGHIQDSWDIVPAVK